MKCDAMKCDAMKYCEMNCGASVLKRCEMVPDRSWLHLILTATLVFCCALKSADATSDTSPDESRPNVLVILTDDQGWGDLSVHGNTNLSTPHLDSLAREGATIQSFYVCQVCAPTRAEFLTGRYYPRTGVSGVSVGQERLNADELTVADLFLESGYVTGAFGKWHNGTQTPYHPNNRGFAEFYGFTSGHWGHYFSPPLDHNGEMVRGKGFVVDDFTNHAIDFIRKHHEEPFFCYLPLNTPHSPMMVSDRFYRKFENVDLAMRHRDPEREDLAMTRAALAMVENIDWNVGRVLSLLEELDIEEETIVVFFSDNGPNSYRWNGGMKGRKGSIDEGGVRSPCFVRWSGHVPAGLHVDQIAGAVDLMPTLVELTGIKSMTERQIDGVSLAPWLTGQRDDVDDRILFSIKKNQVSVRQGDFRLDDQGRLFDVQRDPGQIKDLSGKRPDLTQKLTSLADQHRKAMSLEFAKYSDRPFTVGYSQSTLLPARDGVAHGAISRSSKAPNNSFFENWSDLTGAITWKIEVPQEGDFDAVLRYTCRQSDVGARMRLEVETIDAELADDSILDFSVQEWFDPPLYDKSKERVKDSHYFVKDFKPLPIGRISLPKGRSIVRLRALEMRGSELIDVHSIQFVRHNTR